MVQKALDLELVSTIFHYYEHFIKIINKYCFKLEYGTKQFEKKIYCNSKQVINKSKL